MINMHPRLLGNLQYIPKPTLLPGCLVASTSMILTFRLKKEKQRPELSLARELKKKSGCVKCFRFLPTGTLIKYALFVYLEDQSKAQQYLINEQLLLLSSELALI